MMTWRRREKGDTWHFVKACSNWPKGKRSEPGKPGDVVEQDWKPTTGEMCNQCMSKLAAKAKKIPVQHCAAWAERVWAWIKGEPYDGG